MPAPIAAALDDFAGRVRRRFGPRLALLRLFGSYARGDYRPDSDVDVLVLVEGLGRGERREIYDLAEEVYFDRLIHVSPLVQSTEEFETISRREYLIASEIAREGITI